MSVVAVRLSALCYAMKKSKYQVITIKINIG